MEGQLLLEEIWKIKQPSTKVYDSLYWIMWDRWYKFQYSEMISAIMMWNYWAMKLECLRMIEHKPDQGVKPFSCLLLRIWRSVPLSI